MRAGSNIYVEVASHRVAKIEAAVPEAAGLPDLAPAELGDGDRVVPNPDGLVTAGDAWIAQAVETEVLALDQDQPSAPVLELLAAAARRELAAVPAEARKVTYFHYDHLGSLVAVSDADGEVVERRTQYPYGLDRTPNLPREAEYLFTGKEHDRSTGLVYFGARYYSPRLGRWTSADPAFQEFALADDGTVTQDAVQRLGFALLNPANNVDVLGLATLGIHMVQKGYPLGHAWLTYTDDNGVTTTYGLWPDWAPKAPDNKEGSDIRTGIEANEEPLASRYYNLSESQAEAFLGELEQNVTWSLDYNCSSWAADVVKRVVGEEVDAHYVREYETPRMLGRSIRALEKVNPSSQESPITVSPKKWLPALPDVAKTPVPPSPMPIPYPTAKPEAPATQPE